MIEYFSLLRSFLVRFCFVKNFLDEGEKFRDGKSSYPWRNIFFNDVKRVEGGFKEVG